jgi:hypothetical protein
MLSIISHPHTTLLRALWTSERIPRFAAHGLNLTSATAYSAHSSCGLRAVRPSSLALHFFPHTRPPDIVARLEYQGSLVNTYSCLDLRSIPRHRPKRALALTRSGDGVDLPGDRYTMTGSDDDAPAAVAHFSGAVLGVLTPANLHAPGVLLIFQHRPASLTAPFAVTKTSRTTSTDSFRPLVSSTVGF